MKPARSFATALPIPERIATAKARADRIVDHVSTLFALNEANRHVIYSKTLAQQIPRSHAAHAFHQFQMSMHLFELIRLSALWDNPGRDRESIPTVLALIDDAQITDQLIAETHHFYAEELTPSHLTPFKSEEHEEAYKAWWEQERIERATEEVAKAQGWHLEARAQAAEVQGSPELAALRGFRDRYIAHNLIIPEAPPEAASDVVPLKYGFETKILEATVAIADRLHLFLNGTSFDWQGSREIAAKNAASLWEACRFDGISY